MGERGRVSWRGARGGGGELARGERGRGELAMGEMGT